MAQSSTPAQRRKQTRRFLGEVDAALAETPKGFCPFCLRRIPERVGPGRPRLMCGRPECRREYHAAVRAERVRLGDPSYRKKNPAARAAYLARRRAQRAAGHEGNHSTGGT